MNYTPRFEIFDKHLHWNYRIKWYAAANPHDDGKYWEHEENWYISIGIDNRFFGYEEYDYEFFRHKTITIFGIVFGKGYSYQDERII
jgi:hypothetical protein